MSLGYQLAFLAAEHFYEQNKNQIKDLSSFAITLQKTIDYLTIDRALSSLISTKELLNSDHFIAFNLIKAAYNAGGSYPKNEAYEAINAFSNQMSKKWSPNPSNILSDQALIDKVKSEMSNKYILLKSAYTLSTDFLTICQNINSSGNKFDIATMISDAANDDSTDAYAACNLIYTCYDFAITTYLQSNEGSSPFPSIQDILDGAGDGLNDFFNSLSSSNRTHLDTSFFNQRSPTNQSWKDRAKSDVHDWLTNDHPPYQNYAQTPKASYDGFNDMCKDTFIHSWHEVLWSAFGNDKAGLTLMGKTVSGAEAQMAYRLIFGSYSSDRFAGVSDKNTIQQIAKDIQQGISEALSSTLINNDIHSNVYLNTMNLLSPITLSIKNRKSFINIVNAMNYHYCTTQSIEEAINIAKQIVPTANPSDLIAATTIIKTAYTSSNCDPGALSEIKRAVRDFTISFP